MLPTKHFIDQTLLNEQKSTCALINTSRGEVLNLQNSTITSCLDVFEHEPNIDLKLAQSAFISTPHIAGYSLNAKLAATLQVVKKASQHFGWENSVDFDAILQEQIPRKTIKFDGVTSWEDIVLSCCKIEEDHQALQALLAYDAPHHGKGFEALRRNYALRLEFEIFEIASKGLPLGQQRGRYRVILL